MRAASAAWRTLMGSDMCDSEGMDHMAHIPSTGSVRRSGHACADVRFATANAYDSAQAPWRRTTEPPVSNLLLDAPLVSTMIGIGIPLGLVTATLWHHAFAHAFSL
jgi:hypothetical protein